MVLPSNDRWRNRNVADRDFASLQRLAARVDGQIALSTLGRGESRMFKLWFFDGRDRLFTAPTLAGVIAAAIAATADGERSRRRLQASGAYHSLPRSSNSGGGASTR